VTIFPPMRLNKPNIRRMLDILGSKGLRMSNMNQERVLLRPVGSRLDISGDSSERTLLNGSAIAGPGSNANDSDWNGNSGLPLPQLWDDVGHDISTAAGPGTTQLNFNISVSSSMWDCLTPVANVVSFH
jgi:hypothetical protein